MRPTSRAITKRGSGSRGSQRARLNVASHDALDYIATTIVGGCGAINGGASGHHRGNVAETARDDASDVSGVVGVVNPQLSKSSPQRGWKVALASVIRGVHGSKEAERRMRLDAPTALG